jgi:2-polyprenyl-6-methoxyphenol hydroxylase-like FAD-dependent oxidoreductase
MLAATGELLPAPPKDDAPRMPSLANKTDVLVVGAGPTGLLTALELARAGVEVEIIDRAWHSTAQSFACGLHAATVDLLAQLGLERAALDVGRSIETLAFRGSERRRNCTWAP